jgi:hypothetical protein
MNANNAKTRFNIYNTATEWGGKMAGAASTLIAPPGIVVNLHILIIMESFSPFHGIILRNTSVIIYTHSFDKWSYILQGSQNQWTMYIEQRHKYIYCCAFLLPPPPPPAPEKVKARLAS